MRIHRLTSAAGAVLAAAAFAGPAVAAGPPQDLRSPDARDAAVRSVTSPQDLRSPDARDASTRTVTPVVVRVAGTDSGLEWDSAAIGALAGAGLLISLAGGGVLITRRRPRAARVA
jgi:hypothetical protein